ncbi:MAG: Fic family protein [Prevotellaceae bacterium]|nr:Fic family protein [Prevotellaceae bacterium]
MNDEICYISYEDVLKVYRKMIDASEGGFAGVRDEGGILATLDFVQSDIYYPTFAEKLCCLVFQFCSGHYFNDGNKRIALTLGAYFLHQNHCPWEACIFMRQFEAIVYHVAASNIDQALLLRMMRAFIAREDYDEALKIDIAKAMSRGKLGFPSEGDNCEGVLIR